ncbi:hypothetical protein [Microcella sp.]|uniref:hypothetical protein n=1 Tax=Microcella sp. TaxID=1913979 RepID=UPI00391B67BE
MARGFVAVTAAGAAVIHGAAALTAADGGVGTALALAGAAELVIAVGAAISARWLPAARTVALILATPVLLWATLLLVAVTADSPALASSLATAPLAGASLLGLTGAAFAGADARRTRVGARVRPLRAGIVLATAGLLTALVVTPSVAATLPSPFDAPQDAAPTIVFGDHSGHVGYDE